LPSRRSSCWRLENSCTCMSRRRAAPRGFLTPIASCFRPLRSAPRHPRRRRRDDDNDDDKHSHGMHRCCAPTTITTANRSARRRDERKQFKKVSFCFWTVRKTVVVGPGALAGPLWPPKEFGCVEKCLLSEVRLIPRCLGGQIRRGGHTSEAVPGLEAAGVLGFPNQLFIFSIPVPFPS
jgi:hypothetical protein